MLTRRIHAQRQIDPPADDESHDDFIERCLDELGADDDVAEQLCEMIWDERAVGSNGVVTKTTTSAGSDGMEFVLSDETPDRIGDIIMAAGWQLANFKRNPIALFGHRGDFPIGTWRNLRVEGTALRGELVVAPEGTSERIDEIRRLVNAGILRAVSVGFRPSAYEALKDGDGNFTGYRFTKQELLETSLVSIPANPNALAVAKSLNVSRATIDLVFAGQGRKDLITRQRDSTGGQANATTPNRKGRTMSFAQRIKDAETRLNALRDELRKHLEGIDDTNVSDEDLERGNELKEQIAQNERTLALLRESERSLGATSDDGGRTALVVTTETRGAGGGAGGAAGARTGGAVTAARPFNVSRKTLTPMDLLVRAGTVMLLAHRDRKPPDQVRREIYGEDEATRVVFEWAQRAATVPATTTLAGWAAELVQQIVVEFMATLMPKSVFPRLSGLGLSLTFGRNGKIIIPTRSRTPTIAGSFVGEGAPIPVRQGAFTSQTLTPKKMAVITTWTREIDEHSVPAIEGLLRNAIGEDTAVSLDAVLLDANAATVVRPPGLLNGVAALTATAGGGFNALVGDIKALSGALLTGTAGNVRQPCWIMNPQQVNSAGLIAAPGVGAFPFREEIGQGRLSGWPIIDSGTVPLGTVIAIDAADFVAVGGDAPRFEISDQATLHLEDTAPADIVSGAAPGTPANPVKSMWQTDSLALRLILPVNWALRRTGVIAWTQGVTW